MGAGAVTNLIITAVCYALFHAAMFSGLSAQAMGPARRWTILLAFAFNYVCFIALSVLQFNLMMNWLVVFALFMLEIKVSYRCATSSALISALLVAVIGLGANVITRSCCAIVLDVPQSAFSNDVGNIKTLPVALGFILGALIMYVQRVRFSGGEFSVVCGNVRSRRFVFALAGLGYLYLCSILLLYYVDDNGLVVKLWALKAAASVFVGTSLAFYYAYRTADLMRRAERRRALERDLSEGEREGAVLQTFARRDALTGTGTRSFAMERLSALLEDREPFVLAFVDVNDLKLVNDVEGHEGGDAYLIAVADALDEAVRGEGDFVARYGGDEFLVVLCRTSVASAAKRLDEVQHRLRTESGRGDRPEGMSISYGIVPPRRGDGPAALIARADAAMYRAKRSRPAADARPRA